MSLLRVGIFILPLFISACSLPVLHKSTQQPTEQTASQAQSQTKEETSSSSEAKLSESNLTEKLDDQLHLAKSQYQELNARSGNAQSVPYINEDALTNTKQLSDAIQTLRSYNSQMSVQLAAVDSRVDQRKKANVPGDTIQILVGKLNVTLPKASFETQPLIGQWIRGESRVVRLKDSLLFDAQHSEDVNITYSESYQLLVNGKVISVINPNKEKNHASFNVNTSEDDGSITGSLDYRIVNNNR